MSDETIENLEAVRFVWWNTSLSPPSAKSRATEESLRFVASQLVTARVISGWDVLGLGEVSAADAESLLAAIGDPMLSLVQMAEDPGRAVNDTAIIFNREKLEFHGDRSLYDMHGSRTLKAGHIATFLWVQTGEFLHIAVAHWPGRMYHNEAAPMRIALGNSLHRSLRSFRDAGQHNLVVMGDFNDDPYSPSLAQHLFATRDRALAADKDHFLYNPFWRSLGESQPLGGLEASVCGSHHYAAGQDSRWFTYDQIMFSPAFLGSGRLILDEGASRILPLPELVEPVSNGDSIYDHFPVTSAIYMRNTL